MFLDEGNTLYRNLNKEMISIEKMESRIDIHELKSLIEEHVERTGSTRDLVGRKCWIILRNICRNSRRSSLMITGG